MLINAGGSFAALLIAASTIAQSFAAGAVTQRPSAVEFQTWGTPVNGISLAITGPPNTEVGSFSDRYWLAVRNASPAPVALCGALISIPYLTLSQNDRDIPYNHLSQTWAVSAAGMPHKVILGRGETVIVSPLYLQRFYKSLTGAFQLYARAKLAVWNGRDCTGVPIRSAPMTLQLE